MEREIADIYIVPKGEYPSRIWFFRDIDERRKVEESAAVGSNRSEMENSGRPHKQAVAAALDNQRRSKAQGYNQGDSVEPITKSVWADNLAETAANQPRRLA